MIYCNKCKKEVVIYGISHSVGSDDQLDQMRTQIENEGKLILFNPPPFGSYNCPDCGNILGEES